MIQISIAHIPWLSERAESLWWRPEHQEAELGEGEVDDAEHDAKSEQLIRSQSESGGELIERAIKVNVFEYLLGRGYD